MKNKILTLSLVASLLITSAQASTSALTDAMANITKPGGYTEYDSNGNVKSQNFYTGGVAYRFNNTAYPPPIWSYSPPSLEANCNGINIKGMFASLIGLDQLGTMIQNAGASLAWGVVIGIIYSLPGIAASFKMINEWATRIQQILGNMCQSGIVLGQAMGSWGIDKLTVEKKVVAGSETPAKSMQQGESAVVEPLNMSPHFDENGVFSFGDNPKLPKKDIKDAYSAFYKGTFMADNSMGGTILQTFFKETASSTSKDDILGSLLNGSGSIKSIKLIIVDGDELKINPIVSGSGEETITVGIDKFASYYTDLNKKRQMKLKLFSYVLLYNLTGDIGLNSLPDAKLLSSFSNNADDNATAAEKEAATVNFLKAQNTVDSSRTRVGPGSMKFRGSSSKALVDFLWFGTQAQTAVDTAKSANPSATNQQVDNAFFFKAPAISVIAFEDEKSASKVFMPYLTKGAQTKGFSPTPFKGAYTNSECVISSLIATNAIKDCGLGVTFTGVDKFIATIRNSPSSEQATLKDMLIRYNALETVNGILRQMGNAADDSQEKDLINNDPPIGGSSKAPNDRGATAASASHKAQEAAQLKEEISALIREAKDILNTESTGNFDTLEKISNYFKEKDRENQARGLKAINNK